MVLIFWGGFGQQNRWYIGPLITLAPLLLPLLGSGLLGLPLSLLSLLVSARHSTGAAPWDDAIAGVHWTPVLSKLAAIAHLRVGYPAQPPSAPPPLPRSLGLAAA